MINTPWPYPDIVRMTLHKGVNQWCKKHQGRVYYFGRADDPQAALAKWRHTWPSILNGTPLVEECPTIEEMYQRFLEHKRQQYERGELSWFTYVEHRHVSRLVMRSLGKTRKLDQLMRQDFTEMYKDWTRYSPTTRRKYESRVRQAWDVSISGGPPTITVPTKGHRSTKGGIIVKQLDLDTTHTPNHRVLQEQLLKLPHGKLEPLNILTCYWLGLLCGFGNSDCARLTWGDLRGRWIVTHRPKTGVLRKCRIPSRIHDVLKRPQDATDEQLVLTSRTGGPIKSNHTDLVGKTFKGLGIHFYDLRRTFATLAAETGDDAATRVIMGHRQPDMLHDRYVLRFPENRIIKVQAHVLRRVREIMSSQVS